MCHRVSFSDNCFFTYKLAKKDDWRHPEANQGTGNWSDTIDRMYSSLGAISDQIKEQVEEARESELYKTTRGYQLTSSATENDSIVAFIVKEAKDSYFAVDADWEDKTISWTLSWQSPY